MSFFGCAGLGPRQGRAEARNSFAGRLDKPARLLREGDVVVFAHGGRLASVRVAAPGARRGPPAEARTLYAPLEAGEA